MSRRDEAHATVLALTTQPMWIVLHKATFLRAMLL